MARKTIMMSEKAAEKELKELSAALAKSRDVQEVYDFLYGILTPAERVRLALRWELVKLLLEGVTQRSISEKLRVSLCKITRGSHELKYGPKGFRRLMERSVCPKSAKK